MMGNSNMFVPINNNVGDHERVTFGDNLNGRCRSHKIAISNDLSISNVL